ncbi:MAG: GH1 family beta-glucosidase [Fibrobacterales bacterium]
MSFKKDFVWGAATAAYQIEGSHDIDGKGPSVWDTFSALSGNTYNGDTGNVACDFYNRYTDDIKLMKVIGLDAFRLSIAWTRLLPDGIDHVNQKGIDFYNRLFDTLLENDITPYPTLFHWDYPQGLYTKGGWLNPDAPKWFAEYADLVASKFSDRISNWMTINEPQVFINIGHGHDPWKTHAPGSKLPFKDLAQIAHNVMVSHGQSVSALRAHGTSDTKIGIAPVITPTLPVDSSEEAYTNAYNDYMTTSTRELWSPGFYLDPIYFGKYHEATIEAFGSDMPIIQQGDMELINQPIDFIGANTYFGIKKDFQDGRLIKESPKEPGAPTTAFGWPICDDALYYGTKFLKDRYDPEIFITENGMANKDWISLDGKCHDPQRIDFLHRYMSGLKKAASEGVNISGYFLWSLLDNFEWEDGYLQRFGIIHVDYSTQKRTLKDSAYWYHDIIESNGDLL